MVANREHVVERLAGEFVYGLGTVLRDIDSYFAHHRNGFGPHLAGLGACAGHFEAIARVVA
jgi:hypothetical protein